MATIFDEYHILKTLIVIPGTGKWHKELTLTSWGGKPAVYDLRPWNEDRSAYLEGVMLTEEELKILQNELGGTTR